MSNNKLAGFIERIDSLNADKKVIQTDIAEVFEEAKEAGYDPKIMRLAMRERAMGKATRDARDALMEELGALADTPLGEAAISKVA